MSEDARPPVAIRITRPQATEEAFLEQELETVTRTTVTLLGAHARPQGVVLRFELALSSGLVLLRGEGRVTAFKESALLGLSGLTLRFTRLDSKSKALVDKATGLRDRRRPSYLPPQPEPSVPIVTGPISSGPSVAAGEDSEPPDSSPTVSDPYPSREPPRVVAEPPPLPHFPPLPPPPPPAPPPAASAVAASAPGNREALLARLRTRAKRLDDTTVRHILEQRRRA